MMIIMNYFFGIVGLQKPYFQPVRLSCVLTNRLDDDNKLKNQVKEFSQGKNISN